MARLAKSCNFVFMFQLEERQREGERHRKDTGSEFPTQVQTYTIPTCVGVYVCGYIT